MSEPYEEIVEGESILRFPPGPRHEILRDRLHAAVATSLSSITSILASRDVVALTPGTLLRPDLTLVAHPTRRPWLIAEIINAEDHRPDTVIKKEIYENANIPRLWIIDPRYNNVEIYHGGPYGLALQRIIVAPEILSESLLPGFQLPLNELFS